MKIISVYNRYTVHGGEDEVFRREAELLEAAGHTVLRHVAENSELLKKGHGAAIGAMIWNREAADAMTRQVRNSRADIVHVHNFFAALSPTILTAAHAAGAAVVLTLHNFRLFCVNGMLLRNGKACERCVGLPVAVPGILHACYRGSAAQSAAVAAMVAVHRLAGTWSHGVDRFVTLTENSRRIVTQGGLPAAKVVVKPNFVEDRHDPSGLDHPRHGAVIVGQMMAEKGIALAAQAWLGLDYPVRFLGEGPLRATIGGEGHKTQEEVAQAMRQAAFLVVPSLWYETFGLVVIEAFSAALPVIASGHGALADLIKDGETGLLFRPGDSADLAANIRWAVANPQAMREMGRRARETYERLYTPAANLPQLEAIYEAALIARSAAITGTL
ncbi:Glycosyl transferase group 1 [Candidatus Terasakiella magnetica]|nr:Glycosyl transferase group 1 [Candidatus Terasakiella magnetica]